MSNAEGNRIFRNELQSIDFIELKKSLDFYYSLGFINKKMKNWANSEHEKGRQIFRDIMSRNRFTSILSVIKLDNTAARRKRRSSGSFESIRECFGMWNSYLQEPYIPN